MQRNRRGPAASEARIMTVTQLNRAARRLLEDGLVNLRVEGEISNLARPASGHIYFSLKDDQAQVRCAMFRSANRKLTFRPEHGTQVLVDAKVSIYEARGDYQLIIEHMEEAGEGLLRRRFEALKASLSEEGLFDETHKQALPEMPTRIGVVTSPTGAANRDIINVLRRRYPAAEVIVYPTRVQGDGSAEEIAAAINTAGARDEVDVLIVARGGGSLEDLWSFNEEVVARAIFDCELPTVSGVGHEVDITIADLVADVRAPTPSGAAELVTPDRDTLLRLIGDLQRRTTLAARRQLDAERTRHLQLQARLNRMRPDSVVQQLSQRADELLRRLQRAALTAIAERKAGLRSLELQLSAASPATRIASLRTQLQRGEQSLSSSIRRMLAATERRLAVAAGSLNAVSPLATLERGYAIVRDDQGRVLNDASRLKAGDNLSGQLAKGGFEATVNKVRKD